MSDVTTKKTVVTERRISADTIGKELKSRISGKLLGFDDLFDPTTKTFKTENELKAKGAVFITLDYDKGDFTITDCVKKSRLTKEPTPTIIARKKMQIIGNINWDSYVNKRGKGDFIPSEKRNNGVENVDGCKAIGITSKGHYTINGVVFRVLEKTTYIVDGVVCEDNYSLRDEFFKKTNAQLEKSAKKEAEKHGIDVKFDPAYRTPRIDSCKSIRCFGFDYKPNENHCNQ